MMTDPLPRIRTRGVLRRPAYLTETAESRSFISVFGGTTPKGNYTPAAIHPPDTMSSTIFVNMNTCGRTAKVIVSKREDGDLDVRIESDCQNIQEYARRLTRMTEMDVIDFSNSIVNRAGVRDPLTATCLCPLGVIYAASMELGMMSKRLGQSVHADEIVIDRCDEE